MQRLEVDSNLRPKVTVRFQGGTEHTPTPPCLTYIHSVKHNRNVCCIGPPSSDRETKDEQEEIGRDVGLHTHCFSCQLESCATSTVTLQVSSNCGRQLMGTVDRSCMCASPPDSLTLSVRRRI